MSIVEQEENGKVKGGRIRLSRFAHRLFMEWRRLALPINDETILIAVSGGADSMALLLALDELVKHSCLDVKVLIAHLDHGLRANRGEQDAQWMAEMAAGHGFEIVLGKVLVAERARIAKDNLEQAARRARYEFLAATALKHQARFILTAHTMDDQAETVLLRLLRGSGAEGLSGIDAARPFDAEEKISLVRPLVRWARRAETENYCLKRKFAFRVDEMNQDEKFARVRVRHQLLPLMQTFNCRIIEALSRTAFLLREDASALTQAAQKLLDEASVREAKERWAMRDEKLNERTLKVSAASVAPLLRVDVLACAPSAVRRRALRLWVKAGRGDLQRVEMAHLLAIDALLTGERGGRVAELPGGAFVERRRGLLRLCVKKVEKGDAAV